MKKKSYVNLNANQSLKIFKFITPPEVILQYFIDNPQEKVLEIAQEFVSGETRYISPFTVIRFKNRLSFIQDQDVTVLKVANDIEFMNSINEWRDTRFQGALLFIQHLQAKKWSAVLRVDSEQKQIYINLLETNEVHENIINYLNLIPNDSTKDFCKNQLTEFLLMLSKIPQHTLFASEYKMFTQCFLGKGNHGEVVRVYQSYDCDFNTKSMKLVTIPRAVKIQTKQNTKYDKKKWLNTLIEHYAILVANPDSESAGWTDKSDSLYSVKNKKYIELYTTYIEMEDYTGGIANTGVPLDKLKIKNFPHGIQVILLILQALVKGLHKGDGPYRIVHRDLKQEQIIVNNSCAYIVDFGMACSTTEEIESISGTYIYSAPEATAQKTSIATDYFCFAIIALELIAQSVGLKRDVVTLTRENCFNKTRNVFQVSKIHLDIDDVFKNISLPTEIRLQLYNFLKNMSSLSVSERPTTQQALEFFDQQKINYYAFNFSWLISECVFSNSPLNFDKILKDILDLKNTLFIDKEDIKRINFKMREIDPALFNNCFSESKNSIEKFLESCFFSNLEKNEFENRLTNLSEIIKKDYLFFSKIELLDIKENKTGTNNNFSAFFQTEPLKDSVNSDQKFHYPCAFSESGKN